MLKLILLLCLLSGVELYSQSIEYARSIVTTLASEKYLGRAYSGKADLISAGFIRNEFVNLGIKPLGENYFQFFNLNVNTFPGKMEVKLNNKILIPGINYLVDPSSPSLKGTFQVIKIRKQDLCKPEIVQKAIDSSAGKALLIEMTDTIKYSKEDEETINSLINFIKYDPLAKNSLTILFSDEKLTWNISTWQAKKATIIMNLSGLDLVDISKITVTIQASYKKNYQTQNVAGLIPGKSISDSFLVITAHYDHLGIMGKETYFPGANDNASGIAMMLNICKYFASNPLDYSLIFIAFSGEEAGLLGSKHFIQNALFETGKIRFLINFDLAGTGEDGIKVVNATVFKKEFENLQHINNQLQFLSFVLPRGEACISDHCIFNNNNTPCFYIYTLGGISAYHDIFDKAETLPLSEFEDYCHLMISFLSNF
jgi:aminopeptidase YwaD